MIRIHPSADVSPAAIIGEGCSIWHGVHIREQARLGCSCIVGKNVYIDSGVQIGDNVKIQNNASLYHGLTIEDGVFLGPHVVCTNDRLPRAITPAGALKGEQDWQVGRILIRYGASLGAGVIVVSGVTIGRWALIGAGAVVTRDVPDHALMVGNPAQLRGFVSAGGVRCATQQQAQELTVTEQSAQHPEKGRL